MIPPTYFFPNCQQSKNCQIKKATKKKEPTNLMPSKPEKTLTEHTIQNSQDYRLQKIYFKDQVRKWLKSGDKMVEMTIMAKVDNSEICPCINFIWEQHHNYHLIPLYG